VKDSDSIEYNQISEDWRHRDNLTWQLPSVILVIGSALIVTAFGLDIDLRYLNTVRVILLGLGALLAFSLTWALIQNLWYQVGSSQALINLLNNNGIGDQKTKNKSHRTISPKDLDITYLEFVKRLVFNLTGSFLLIILSISITVILVWLFLDIIIS
jgi:hypothetical protein